MGYLENIEAGKNLPPEERQGQETQQALPGIKSEPVVAAPRKPSTKPWAPASLLDLEGKDPNYRYRWAHKSVVSKRLREGWEIVDGRNHRHGLPTVIDGQPLDSTVQMRDLIAMRLHKDIAKQRDKYFKDLNAVQAKEKMQKPLQEATEGAAYGKVEITMGEEPE